MIPDDRELRLERERDEARRELAELKTALGMAEAWPILDVLDRLSSAATHLLKDHGCDKHGWESVDHARIWADEYVKRLTKLLRGG